MWCIRKKNIIGGTLPIPVLVLQKMVRVMTFSGRNSSKVNMQKMVGPFQRYNQTLSTKTLQWIQKIQMMPQTNYVKIWWRVRKMQTTGTLLIIMWTRPYIIFHIKNFQALESRQFGCVKYPQDIRYIPRGAVAMYLFTTGWQHGIFWPCSCCNNQQKRHTKEFGAPSLVRYAENVSYWLHDLNDKSKYLGQEMFNILSTEGTTEDNSDLEISHR